MKIRDGLEGGVVVETVAGSSLEFLLCTLHAVFTTNSRFLAGINYTELQLADVISEMLSCQFAKFLDRDLDTMSVHLKAIDSAINYEDDNLFISVLRAELSCC